MLPVALVDDVTAVHMLLSVGLMVVLQVATKPASVTLLSLWKDRNIFPDEATTVMGVEGAPVNVSRSNPVASVPSYIRK